MLSGAMLLFGAGALTKGQIAGLEFTAASEVVTEVSGKWHSAITLSDFATGVATLTFPKHFKFFAGLGFVNTDNATASSRQALLVNNVDLSAGTATVRCVDSSNGATEAIGNGTYRLVLAMGE
jgi:hypothetical protein